MAATRRETSSSSAPAEPTPAETDWSADIASSWRGAPDDEEDGDRSFATPDTPTLRDHLLSQLSLTKLDERDRAFVMVLIDALDEDGYLTQPLEEIAALLPPEAEAGMEELGIALRHLQHFEPAGVGARSPGECLRLRLEPCKMMQCEASRSGSPKSTLDLLASRDYTRLKNVTGASEERCVPRSA